MKYAHLRKNTHKNNDWIKMSLLKSAFIIGTFLTATSAKNYEYKPVPYKPYQAENGSYRGEMNTKTYRPKTEYVRPYKHKDGSRVRSHYRNRKK